MSNPVKITQRIGAYDHPFSGQGVPFDPLGVQYDRTGLVLHEAGYDPANGNWNFPSVLSPFWRVYYNEQRSHCIVFGDDFYELGPDIILMIPEHQFFHCLGQRPTPSFWMHFSCKRKPALNQAVPIVLKPETTELEIIHSLRSLISGKVEGDRQRIYQLSTALLNVLTARPELEWRPELPKKLTDLIQFIEEHAHEKIPNERLATNAGISVEGIYRLFRQHLGTSPANYINQIRVRKSSLLLYNHNTSIDEVAELTGFPNRAYFSRVFKQVTGMAPGAFRSQRIEL